jgi:hypothetical protein
VRARLAGVEEGAVPGLELTLAVRRAQRRPPHEDDQPLLLGVLVVVRTDAQAGRELVQRQAELLAADERPDAGIARSVSRRLIVIHLELELEEVGHAHCSPSQ